MLNKALYFFILCFLSLNTSISLVLSNELTDHLGDFVEIEEKNSILTPQNEEKLNHILKKLENESGFKLEIKNEVCLFKNSKTGEDQKIQIILENKDWTLLPGVKNIYYYVVSLDVVSNEMLISVYSYGASENSAAQILKRLILENPTLYMNSSNCGLFLDMWPRK